LAQLRSAWNLADLDRRLFNLMVHVLLSAESLTAIEWQG